MVGERPAWGRGSIGVGERCMGSRRPRSVWRLQQNLQMPGCGYVALLNEMVHTASSDGRPCASGVRAVDGSSVVLEGSGSSSDREFLRAFDVSEPGADARRGAIDASGVMTCDARQRSHHLDQKPSPSGSRAASRIPLQYACHEGNYGMFGLLNGARASREAGRGGKGGSGLSQQRLSFQALTKGLAPGAPRVFSPQALDGSGCKMRTGIVGITTPDNRVRRPADRRVLALASWASVGGWPTPLAAAQCHPR